MDNEKKIEINNILSFVTNELILFKYLVSRKNIKFLLVKDYKRVKYDFIKEDILKQRLLIENLMKKNKSDDFLQKKLSLENRFESTKQELLKDAEIKTSYYTEFLNILENIYNKNNLFLEYNMCEKNLLFPVKIYKVNNEFYIENKLNKSVLIFDNNKYKNFDLNEHEVNLFIEEVSKKTKKIFINSLDIEQKYNENNFEEKFSKIISDSKHIIWNKNDFKLLDLNENIFIEKEKLTKKDEIFENILIEAILKNKNILVLKNSGILKIRYSNFTELKNELISIENEIIKKKILEKFLNNQIGETLNETHLLNEIQEQKSLKKNYEVYKKNLMVSKFKYDEIKNELDNINDNDISTYCNFIKLKCNTNFFNEEVFTSKEIFNYMQNLIIKIKMENEMVKNKNKQYYKNIIWAINEKRDLLDKNDLLKISKLIRVEDKQVKAKKNVLAKIFDSINIKKQEIILEKEEKCLNEITSLYKLLAKNLKELKELNQNIFIVVIKVLSKENFNTQIDNILNDINLRSIYNEKIKNWSFNKYSLIEYLTNNNENKKSVLNFKLFQLIEEKNKELKIKDILKTELDLKSEREFVLQKIKNEFVNIKVNDYKSYNQNDSEYNIILTSKIDLKNFYQSTDIVNINKKFIIFEDN
ncbi:MAG: hypothetical protein ACRC57_02950 [Sarcina sp.]